MDLTPEEILELHKKQESDISIEDFVLNLYNQDKNNTTDPKKAKGDVKKDANTDPKNTASKSANGLSESLAYDTDKTYEELRQEALQRRVIKPLLVPSERKEAEARKDATKIERVDVSKGLKFSNKYKEPRINVVIGMTPWLNYDEEKGCTIGMDVSH